MQGIFFRSRINHESDKITQATSRVDPAIGGHARTRPSSYCGTVPSWSCLSGFDFFGSVRCRTSFDHRLRHGKTENTVGPALFILRAEHGPMTIKFTTK